MSGITCTGNVPEGWHCPVCGKVNAPWVSQCPCSGYHTTSVDPKPWWADPNQQGPQIICCVKD